MIKLNRTVFISVVFLIIHIMCFSQRNADANFLFKTWLYIEHINDDTRYNVQFPIKDSSVFSLFMNNISLRLDTLKSHGFSEEYIFFSLQLSHPTTTNKDSLKSLQYVKETQFLQYIVIPSFCSRYVLCINKTTGFSYRLQGFTGNDFLNLLKDVKFEFNLRNKRQLKIKDFFKDYSVGDIDFKCIYKGLQTSLFDINKYPCLYNCRGSSEIIWTQ